MIDLTEFRPIPFQPSYLIARDGRVASLKKTPVALLTPTGSDRDNGVWRRVRLGRTDFRLRDLLSLTWGPNAALNALCPNRNDDEES